MFSFISWRPVKSTIFIYFTSKTITALRLNRNHSLSDIKLWKLLLNVRLTDVPRAAEQRELHCKVMTPLRTLPLFSCKKFVDVLYSSRSEQPMARGAREGVAIFPTHLLTNIGVRPRESKRACFLGSSRLGVLHGSMRLTHEGVVRNHLLLFSFFTVTRGALITFSSPHSKKGARPCTIEWNW